MLGNSAQIHSDVFEQIALSSQEGQLAFVDRALYLVVMADAAAGHFQFVLQAGLARGNEGAVMAHLFEVRAVAAAWAVTGGLVADLAVFGDEPHGNGFPSTQNSAEQELQKLQGSGGVWQSG